jgi:polysaccharide export outer membrane protein
MKRSTGACLSLFCIALLFVTATALTGCGGVTRTARVEPVTMTSPVIIGPGDVIRINFNGAPEMSQSLKIRADGKVTLPVIGPTYVANRTLPQLESELKRLYSSQLANSDIVVTLESGSIEVYIAGSVRSPGKLAFDRPTTMLQAIMQAGGPTPFGNLRSVHLIRITNGIERTQLVDLRPTLAGRTTKAFYVKNGDIIQVPQSAF